MQLLQNYRFKDMALNLLVVVIYVLLAKVGLFFALKNPTITIFWPAGGFAFAVLLLGGQKYLPSILIGGLVAGLMAVENVWVATMLGVADSVESYVAFWLLTRKLNFNAALESKKDFLKLTLVAGGLSSAISAVIAAATLVLWNVIPFDLCLQIGSRWWMGDVLGIAFVTPLILIWRKLPQKLYTKAQVFECVLVFILAFLVGQILFFNWFRGFAYVPNGISWIILLLVWSALRLGRHHVTALQMLVFIQALWSASQGMQHYGSNMLQSSLVDFWMFGMTIAVGGVALAIITLENTKTQSSLRESEERLRLALAAGHQGWFDVNVQTGEVNVGPEYANMLGFDSKNFHSSLDEWKANLHPDDRDLVSAAFSECLATGLPKLMEYRRRSANGDWVWISSVGKVAEWDKNGQPIRMIGTHTNITQRKRVENELREQKEFFRVITDNSADYIAVLDLHGRRIYNNHAYASLFGGIEQLEGTDSFAEIHPDDRERIKQIFQETIQTGQGQRTEFRFLLGNGAIRYMESAGGLIKDSNGKPTSVIVVSHDITERKQAEQEIKNLAFYDQLTQLPNRRLLNDRLDQSMASSKRSGSYCALLFLDLDNFKPLNDAHGHPVGDILLSDVATRLTNCVREVDTVARFGGDEFVIVLNELGEDSGRAAVQAANVAEKICSSISKPYVIKISNQEGAGSSIEHRCAASVGVTLFLNHEVSPDEVLNRADAAMYQAKEAGGNQVKFYDGPA